MCDFQVNWCRHPRRKHWLVILPLNIATRQLTGEKSCKEEEDKSTNPITRRPVVSVEVCIPNSDVNSTKLTDFYCWWWYGASSTVLSKWHHADSSVNTSSPGADFVLYKEQAIPFFPIRIGQGTAAIFIHISLLLQGLSLLCYNIKIITRFFKRSKQVLQDQP